MSSILHLMNNPAPQESMKKCMRDSAVEFVATTLFVFTGTLSAVSTGFFSTDTDAGDVARILPIAMSFGIAILALAHSIGHLTGGHMNPGVSLLMFFKAQITSTKLVMYWVAQFLGGLLGAALTWGCTSGIVGFADNVTDPPFNLGSTTLSPELSTGNGFLIEFMGSLIFYFVIAQTALDNRGVAGVPGVPALPIGLVLVAVHVCLIPFTGCGVNPARTFGPSMVTCMSSNGSCSEVAGSWYWIYFVGPFAASLVAAELTHLMSMDCEECSGAAESEKAKNFEQESEPDTA